MQVQPRIALVLVLTWRRGFGPLAGRKLTLPRLLLLLRRTAAASTILMVLLYPSVGTPAAGEVHSLGRCHPIGIAQA